LNKKKSGPGQEIHPRCWEAVGGVLNVLEAVLEAVWRRSWRRSWEAKSAVRGGEIGGPGRRNRGSRRNRRSRRRNRSSKWRKQSSFERVPGEAPNRARSAKSSDNRRNSLIISEYRTIFLIIALFSTFEGCFFRVSRKSHFRGQKKSVFFAHFWRVFGYFSSCKPGVKRVPDFSRGGSFLRRFLRRFFSGFFRVFRLFQLLKSGISSNIQEIRPISANSSDYRYFSHF